MPIVLDIVGVGHFDYITKGITKTFFFDFSFFFLQECSNIVMLKLLFCVLLWEIENERDRVWVWSILYVWKATVLSQQKSEEGKWKTGLLKLNQSLRKKLDGFSRSFFHTLQLRLAGWEHT